MPSNTQFSKPLFINGNFNRSGSRSHFAFVSLLPASPYDLRIWRRDGAPDNNYPRGANDTHFLYVDIDGWMIPIGFTAATLEAQAGRHFLTVRTRGFMLEKLAAFYVEEDGHVERMQYYRMGGRKYTGDGIYKILTDICMAAREKVCA